MVDKQRNTCCYSLVNCSTIYPNSCISRGAPTKLDGREDLGSTKKKGYTPMNFLDTFIETGCFLTRMNISAMRRCARSLAWYLIQNLSLLESLLGSIHPNGGQSTCWGLSIRLMVNLLAGGTGCWRIIDLT
jgi:hypothetical protein